MTTDGTVKAVDDAAVTALRSELRGELLLPGDASYDEARTIWNAMIDRRPAVIVRCQDASDVARAVDFARELGLLLAVRSGGHNIAGSAVCDDGVVTDLSQMTAVRVDAEARRATVDAGATLADVDAATQAHRVAEPHVRHDGRQPRVRRGGHRGRADRPGERDGAPRPLLGASRRGRQLRRGDAVRVPPPSCSTP